MSYSSSDSTPDNPTPQQQQPSQNPSSNDNDPNFIPIALPMGDVDPSGDINSIPPRRRHRRFRKHMMPVSPPLTETQFESLFVDWDDYYVNPLVSHPVWGKVDFEIDQLDQILSQFNQMPQQPPDPMQEASFAGAAGQDSSVDTSSFDIPSLLRPDVSKQKNVQFPSDPYNVPGKVVKHGDVLVNSVDVSQNSNWAAGIDFYEEGRLISFSITCNDPDMVPNIFVESGSSSQTVVNNLSFRELVQHGRGMTYSAATSIINTPNGIMSRDIQGTPSTTFPYVARYKDQLTGDGIYDDVKDTVDDKAYTLIYEPLTSLPYQRLSFQVYNGSTLGNRMINRLEIHRIIYIDPDPATTSTTTTLPEMNKLTAALNTMGSNMGIGLPQAITKTYGSNMAREHSKYDDLLRFLYHQRFGKKNNVDMKYEKPTQISSFEDQKRLNELEAMIGENDLDTEASEDTDEEQDEANRNIKTYLDRNKEKNSYTQEEDTDEELSQINRNIKGSMGKNSNKSPMSHANMLDIIWE